METRKNRNVIVFVLIIALVASMVTPLMFQSVNAAGTDTVKFDEPTAAAIEYPDTLSESALLQTKVYDIDDGGSTTPLAGTWVWETPNLIPNATQNETPQKYTAKFEFATDALRALYGSVTIDVEVEVAMGELESDGWFPFTASLFYGEYLTEAALSGPHYLLDKNGTHIYGRWTWDNGDTIIPTAGATHNEGTKDYNVTFTPNDYKNFKIYKTKEPVHTYQARPSSNNTPTTSAVTYGSILSYSAIGTANVKGYEYGNYRNEAVPGYWRWEFPSTTMSSKNKTQRMVFCPNDYNNYIHPDYRGNSGGIEPLYDTVQVEITKANPVVAIDPRVKSITYGDTLTASDILDGKMKVSDADSTRVYGEWKWSKQDSVMPNAGNPTIGAVFEPDEDDDFNDVNYNIPVVVKAATPKISGEITVDSLEYGQKLSDAAIVASVAGVVNNDEVLGTWAWEDGSEVITKTGTIVRTATFTPESSNYKPITEKIEVEVTKAKAEIEVAPTATAIEYLSILDDSTISAGKVVHGSKVLEGSWSWKEPTKKMNSISTEKYEAVFNISGSALSQNYEPITTDVSVEVKGGSLFIKSAPDIEDIQFGDQLKDAKFGTSTMVNSSDTIIPGEWKWADEDAYPNAGEGVTFAAIFDPTNENYGDFTTTFAINVDKADPEPTTTPSGTRIKYLTELTYSAIKGEVKGVTPATISGVWKWDDPTTVPAVGDKQEFAATFYPESPNYNTVGAMATVTVYNKELTSGALKASSEGTGDPVDEVTYDAIIAKTELGDSKITGPATLYYEDEGQWEDLPGSWSWDNDDQVVTTGTITVAALFTPNDENFGPVIFIININVIRIIINGDELITSTGGSIKDSITIEEGTIPYGEIVSEYAITAPAVYYTGDNGDPEKLPGKWKWKNATDKAIYVGANTITAIYVPDDKDFDEIEVDIIVVADKKIVDIDELYTDEEKTTTVQSILGLDRDPGVNDEIGSYTVSGPGTIYYYDDYLEDFVEIEGTWSWSDDEYKITSGANTVSAIFTHENSDYGDIEIEVTFSALKQALDVDKMYDSKSGNTKIVDNLTSSALSNIVPGKSLTNQAVTWPAVYYDKGEESRTSIAGVWTWDGNADFIPTPGEITLNVMFKPTDNERWSDKRITVTIIVNPIVISPDEISTDDGDKTVEEQINTDDNIVSGDALSDHEPNGPDLYIDDEDGNKKKIDGRWKWKDENEIPPAGGSTVTAIFVPTDTNYKEIEYVNVYIYVFPPVIDKEVITTGEDSDSDSVEESIKVDKGNFEAGGKLGDIIINGPTIYYNNQELIGDWEWKNKDVVPPVGKSTQTAIFKPSNQGMDPIEFDISVDVDPVEVMSLSLGQTTSKVINKNSQLQLTVDLKPANATNKTLTWSSSNPNAATVDSNGLVVAKNTEAKTTITVVSNNGKSAKLDLTVAAPVTKMRTPLSTVYMKKKTSYKIPVVADNGNKKITSKLTYKSSNKKVATVSKSGKITAKKKGTAKITITAYNGKKKVLTIKVVNKKKTLKKASVKLPKKMTVGKTKQLKVKLKTKKATNVKITYKSSNKKVATVDKAGRITAKKKGKTKITVKIGSKVYKKTLKVTKAKSKK